MGGDRRPRGEAEIAGDQIAAVHGGEHAGRGGALAHPHLSARAAEDLPLGLFGPMRGDQEAVRGAERVAPGRRWMADSQLVDHLDEGRIVELVAAEDPGLQDAVEAGLAEFLVDLRPVPAPPIRSVLVVAQHLPHRPGAPDDVVGRQAGFRLLQWRARCRRLALDHIRLRHLPPFSALNRQWRRGAALASGLQPTCAGRDSAHM